MKKIILRLAALSLLIVATFYFGSSSQACVDCGGEMFTAMYGCDNAFTGKVDSYRGLTLYNPNQCRLQAIAQCGIGYGTCYDAAYSSCATPIIAQYNTRYNDYTDCLNDILGVSPEPCTHSPDYCPEAYGRRDQCVAFYLSIENPTIEDSVALQDCIAAIPNKHLCPGIDP